MVDSLKRGAIGVFDSGYGGLTILKEIVKLLPHYDYIYLGDNARTPFGSRSFETVYQYTAQAVEHLFQLDSPLVILACNTASAKALRTIQQNDLLRIDASRRVLGVIRPTVELLSELSQNGHIGIFATQGTVASESYPIEISKLYGEDHFKVSQVACPMWVPLVESGELEGEGAEFYVKKYIEELFLKDSEIDTIILGCTHYPLLENQIKRFVPKGVRVISQGTIVAESLKNYLERHKEMEERITQNGTIRYLTTERGDNFAQFAQLFMGHKVQIEHIDFED